MLDFSSPTVYIPSIFLVIVAIFASILWRDSKKFTHDNTKGLPYASEIELSMDYIVRNILENGRFQYRRNVSSDIEYENKTYNSLRHAGVLYSMYMYEKLGLDDKYFDDRVRASKYFIKRYIKPYKNTGYMVISLPEEEGIKATIAKTGAVGVALSALSNLCDEKVIKLDVLHGLGEFLLSMQEENGNFYAYYNCEICEIDKTAEAIYYPGEAAAGLMHLYDTDGDEKWVLAAKKAVLYLAKTRKSMDLNVPFDHWSILAIQKLIECDLLTFEEAGILKSYTEQMAISMLNNQITNPKNVYYGAFKENVRPGSLGTIMEGLASVYLCTDSEQLKKIIIKALSIGNYFLSRTQVKTGKQAGGLPNSANWVVPGITPNASIIRIDNVQHVVMGWLKYQYIISLLGSTRLF